MKTTMNIEILQLLDGARQAKGLTVIIDVFRAFSLECYMHDMGVKDIIAIGKKEDAYDLKKKYPDIVLVGERQGKKIADFDYGNSPSQLEGVNLLGKTVAHSTSSGTQGIVNAANADEVITGSLVNASAVAEYIRLKHPESVSLVCMGLHAAQETEEDTLCAEYIKAMLMDQVFEIEEGIRSLIRTSGRKFFDHAQREVFPEKDFWMCTEINKFPFVIRAEKSADGLIHMRKICRFS